MADSPEIPLKNPHIAALLAFLVPGLGHYYQGRKFKAAIYSVCILGTFFTGMWLGDWTVVYINWGKKDRIIPQICQVWNGIFFLPAVIQAKRAANDENPHGLSYPTSGSFSGVLQNVTAEKELGGELTGTLSIEPAQGPGTRGYTGKFEGQLDGKYPVVGRVAGLSIDPQVAPFRDRNLEFVLDGAVGVEDTDVEFRGDVTGGIRRSWLDRYDAPLRDDRQNGPTELEIANDYLGRYFDLGTLFTMVAGLLNVLAIYDALEGPAYGYDGEEDADKDDNKKEDKTASKEAAPEKKEAV